MSFATLRSRAEFGIQAPEVSIEVFLSGGLPSFSIVGMAETAVRESKDRVRGALLGSGFSFPQQRITVSLGPADMRKSGGRFDLPIALGILYASRQLGGETPADCEFYGELSLAGDLKRVPGLLPAAMRSASAGRSLVVPSSVAEEAALSGATTYAARSLLDVTAHLRGLQPIEPAPMPAETGGADDTPDLSDVRGQSAARRALEVAAAGGHNLLLIGPPGTGKTMLARRLPGLLPPLTRAEALETAAVHSILGDRSSAADFLRRPFRSPHHSASAAALAGGGVTPRPGEVSQAHNGVLFLDELPEFNRNVLEVLREPMEAGRLTIARAAYRATFPARFQLVAAMNPCPCGYAGDADGTCRCSQDRISNYQGRISGPLLDRIDMHIEMRRQRLADIRARAADGESTADIAKRVRLARERAIRRQGVLNARASAELTNDWPDRDGWRLLERAADRFRFSARASYRIIAVARTIADLEEAEDLSASHVAEALSFRGLDRGATGLR